MTPLTKKSRAEGDVADDPRREAKDDQDDQHRDAKDDDRKPIFGAVDAPAKAKQQLEQFGPPQAGGPARRPLVSLSDRGFAWLFARDRDLRFCEVEAALLQLCGRHLFCELGQIVRMVEATQLFVIEQAEFFFKALSRDAHWRDCLTGRRTTANSSGLKRSGDEAMPSSFVRA